MANLYSLKQQNQSQNIQLQKNDFCYQQVRQLQQIHQPFQNNNDNNNHNHNINNYRDHSISQTRLNYPKSNGSTTQIRNLINESSNSVKINTKHKNQMSLNINSFQNMIQNNSKQFLPTYLSQCFSTRNEDNKQLNTSIDYEKVQQAQANSRRIQQLEKGTSNKICQKQSLQYSKSVKKIEFQKQQNQIGQNQNQRLITDFQNDFNINEYDEIKQSL
ncbi:hypothetical protein ABPG72_009752 [Tetrahymena utriculariae]